MKRWQKVLITGLLSLGVATTAFATSNYTNPAQIVAALTNRSVDSVVDERYQTGKTFGMIADEAGKLIEFKQEMLELKKDELAKCVADGTMTQERADQIIERMRERQAYCDGEGYHRGHKYNCDYNNDCENMRYHHGRHHRW